MGNTVEKYLSQILEVASQSGIYAYRGQQDSEWSLHSGATRRLIEVHGKDVLQDAEFSQTYVDYHRDTHIEPGRTRGFGIESGRPLSDLELLAKLQHFGASTGLLDFSWSPFVALWFASQDPSCDGKLFAVNTNDPITVARVSSDANSQRMEVAFLRAVGEPLLSYWEPASTGDASARILRQRSVFLIGRPLLPINAELIREIIITKDDKQLLRSELEILDFHQESLFQDVYGFAQASNMRPVSPLTAQAYERIGNRHYQRQEYNEALVAYSKSIEISPDADITYLLRGNVYAATGKHLEAIEDYNSAVENLSKISPGVRDTVYFNRGNSKAECRDYEGAIQDYTEAIKLNPSLAQGYYNRGNTYADLYRFQEALCEYDQVTGMISRDAKFNKGNAFLALGQLSEAQICYQNAASQGADHFGITQNLYTLEQIIPVVEGLSIEVVAAPDEQTLVRFL